MRKFFFIKVHIYILGPKLLQWNFLQIYELSIRSGAHKLFCQFFGLFAIFDRNFMNTTPSEVLVCILSAFDVHSLYLYVVLWLVSLPIRLVVVTNSTFYIVV